MCDFDAANPSWTTNPRIVVVGGGAAGVELAWGLKYRIFFGDFSFFRARYKKWKPSVTLINSKKGLVSDMGSSTEECVQEQMDEHRIKVINSERCVEVPQLRKSALILSGKGGRSGFNEWHEGPIRLMLLGRWP